MSSPIVIHLHRPYASEEEYIAHERFSIEAKSMLLIDQPSLPLDTAVVFDVTLDNGQKPIRAEARVIGYVEPEGARPGGLRVRFRRFGAATKAFIDRAVNGTLAMPPAESSPVASPPVVDAPRAVPPSPLEAAPLSARVATPAVEAAHSVVEPSPAATSPSDQGVVPSPNVASLDTPAPLQGSQVSESDEESGIHKKTSMPYVAAPANREALLARLRGRRLA